MGSYKLNSLRKSKKIRDCNSRMLFDRVLVECFRRNAIIDKRTTNDVSINGEYTVPPKERCYALLPKIIVTSAVTVSSTGAQRDGCRRCCEPTRRSLANDVHLRLLAVTLLLFLVRRYPSSSQSSSSP